MFSTLLATFALACAAPAIPDTQTAVDAQGDTLLRFWTSDGFSLFEPSYCLLPTLFVGSNMQTVLIINRHGQLLVPPGVKRLAIPGEANAALQYWADELRAGCGPQPTLAPTGDTICHRTMP